MLRERVKRKARKTLSTDAEHRDGLGRSSEEAAVMVVERRSPGHLAFKQVNQKWEELVDKVKSFDISKHVVWEAFKRVKSNQGSAGIDAESIADFEENLKDNLFKIWNRMSSGSYFPPAVKAVEIPKKCGSVRTLGIPTVSDRIAQMVAKTYLEPLVEPVFHQDSYGYRPRKSAIDAIAITRKRCWQYDWVLEYDIKGLFDNIDHSLMLRAVKHHTDCKWLLLYIERWLKAPMQRGNGEIVERTAGTPQGGVISPLLANLFLHYVFDMWMQRRFPGNPWARFADDAVVHCRTEDEAKQILDELKVRLEECGLALHPEKTRIIYCKDDDRREDHAETKFDFLGYTFRPRRSKNRWGKYFVNFTPAVSDRAAKSMRHEIRNWRMHLKPDKSLEDFSRMFNPTIRGWVNYYGRFYKSMLYPILKHLNRALVQWVRWKFKRFKRHKTRAVRWLSRIAKREKRLFVHWQMGIMPGATK